MSVRAGLALPLACLLPLSASAEPATRESVVACAALHAGARDRGLERAAHADAFEALAVALYDGDAAAARAAIGMRRVGGLKRGEDLVAAEVPPELEAERAEGRCHAVALSHAETRDLPAPTDALAVAIAHCTGQADGYLEDAAPYLDEAGRAILRESYETQFGQAADLAPPGAPMAEARRRGLRAWRGRSERMGSPLTSVSDPACAAHRRAATDCARAADRLRAIVGG